MVPPDTTQSVPKKPRKSREQRRREISRVAARLFAEKGYDATGINELVEATGIGKGAFYYHIGSKEELLYEIAVEHVRTMTAFGQALVERTDLSAPEKFRELSRELMRTIVGNLPELTVFFREVGALTRGNRGDELMELRDQFERVWRRIVAEGVAEGVFKELDPVAIKCILGMHNYSYIWIRPRGRLSPEDLSDVICEVALKGLYAEPE